MSTLAFIERNSFDALMIRAYPERLRGALVYPDSVRTELSRPWYASYMPRVRRSPPRDNHYHIRLRSSRPVDAVPFWGYS